MTRGLVAIGAVMLCAGLAHAQPRSYQPGEVQIGRREAEAPFIDLYSFGRGARIFEKFGHSAICIRYHDPMQDAVCFNYGITTFDDGASLVWGFLRSHQRFWVAPTPERELLRFYEHEDRTIWRQTLPLTAEQARQLEAKLWSDIREENRYYFYDHFADNCTTRLRDMIDHVTGGALARGADVEYPLTFRELGKRGLAELPPVIALTDFVVGRTLDRKPTLWEMMFLPEFLRDVVKDKLGAQPILVYERKGPPFPTEGPSDRGWVLLIGLGFAAPLALAIAIGRGVRAALVIAAVPLVVMGVLIWGLAIVSSIPGLRWNEAVVLFVPFDVLLPVLRGDARRRYAQIRAGMVVWVSVLCAVGVFRQPLWVPIVCAFAPHALVAWIEPMRDRSS